MRRATACLALLALVCAAGCRETRDPSPAAPHAIRYRLAWDTADAKAADAGVFTTTTDRGYRIRITRGYLTNYSMELVECAPPVAPLALLGSVLSTAVEGTAYAGHASGTPNPAAVRPMQVESLTAPVALAAGRATPPAQTYCQLHYLIARAGAEARGLPSDLDMVDVSLHIEGDYTPPGVSKPLLLKLHTAIANGVLLDHVEAPAAPLRVDTGRAATRVTIRRHLTRAFDGIDFATVAESAVAERVLQSLVDHVDVEIEPDDEVS